MIFSRCAVGGDVTYGMMISWKLLRACFPTMMIPSWTHSSARQPAGSHCEETTMASTKWEKLETSGLNYMTILEFIYYIIRVLVTCTKS